MPGALEGLDEVLAGVDGGGFTAAEAIKRLLAAQIELRNHRMPRVVLGIVCRFPEGEERGHRR